MARRADSATQFARNPLAPVGHHNPFHSETEMSTDGQPRDGLSTES